jgi:hypothetical protein
VPTGQPQPSSADTHPAPDLLAWAIKRSLIAYVQRMPDGQIWLSPEVQVSAAGEFLFPRDEPALGASGAPQLAFRGEVGLTAHRGFLHLLVADPRIEADGTLTVRIASHDGDQPPVRIALARLEPGDEPGACRCLLTDRGAEHFGDSYPAGSELAPLAIGPRST